MTAITLMAKALAHELRERGFIIPSEADCETIIKRVLERSASAANAARAANDRPDGGAC